MADVTAAPAVGHPSAPGYADAWGRAWSGEPAALCAFYSPDTEYVDVAMGTVWHRHDGLRRFHAHMSRFIADNEIVFDPPRYADGGELAAEWTWSGLVIGPLQLPDGGIIDLAGQRLSSRGVAVCAYDSAGLITSHRDYWDLATMLRPAGIFLQ